MGFWSHLDILCLSETYLDATISSNDSNLIIPGYNLYRADHPSNVKREGTCIYYKNLLPSSSSLHERGVWHYQKANIENIRKAISQFLWERHFAKSDVKEKVYLFNKTIMKIVCNYIPQKQLFALIEIHLGLLKI